MGTNHRCYFTGRWYSAVEHCPNSMKFFCSSATVVEQRQPSGAEATEQRRILHVHAHVICYPWASEWRWTTPQQSRRRLSSTGSPHSRAEAAGQRWITPHTVELPIDSIAAELPPNDLQLERKLRARLTSRIGRRAESGRTVSDLSSEMRTASDIMEPPRCSRTRSVRFPLYCGRFSARFPLY